MDKKKVVIIGVDGANNITGSLLGIRNLSPFLSTLPPYTPPAWTSILTGVTPAKHEVFGWQKLDFHRRRISIATSHDVKVPRITELLDIIGKKTILINLPMTYPFSGIQNKRRAIIVSDWAAPIQAIYPKKIEDNYKEYLVESPHLWWLNESKKDKIEYTKRIREYLDVRLNLYYSLLEEYEWDFYFIVFSEIDWISHTVPEILNGKTVGDVKKVFNMISKFIEYSKNLGDVVFIVSDHGFEIKQKEFKVNSALAEGGFLRPLWSFSGKLYNSLANIGHKILPRIIQEKLLRHIKSPTVSNFEKIIQDKRTKAIMIEPANWGVYLLNNSTASAVATHLKQYPLIKDVLTFEEVYGVRRPLTAPSLFVIPEKGVTFSSELAEEIERDIYKGDHELHGIFHVWGDGIVDIPVFDKPLTVHDVVPTVLHIMGLPIPKYVDGRVLREIFDENSEFLRRKIRYTEDSLKPLLDKSKLKQIGENLKTKRRNEQW